MPWTPWATIVSASSGNESGVGLPQRAIVSSRALSGALWTIGAARDRLRQLMQGGRRER